MKALALLKVSVTVSDLDRIQDFYVDALGFSVISPAADVEPAVASVLGGAAIRAAQLQRGSQFLELLEFQPAGALYPQARSSNDLWFQHIALVTGNIVAAYTKLSRYNHTPISRHGPQTLPGGITAYKFRDTDGHPLELIEFPQEKTASAGGIDHTAISVTNAEASIAFYTQELGLTIASRQVNTGPDQDALDDLNATLVDVVGLAPDRPTPHIELLGYRTPSGRASPPQRQADIATTRSVLLVDDCSQHPDRITLPDGANIVLMRDPDGHALLLCDRV